MTTEKSGSIPLMLEIMQKLRDPKNGCPWDIQQNFSTIAPYTIEEAYELAEAITREDFDAIKDEIADVLFQVIFYAQLGKERSVFDFDSITKHLCEKLIRRHPHVFGDEEITDEAQLQKRWDEIKKSEKDAKPALSTSVFDGITEGLPPIIKAEKLQNKCARVGFDWPNADPIYDKILEEIDEVKDAVLSKKTPTDNEHVTEEVGDLMFAVINLARHLNVNPETALRLANTKFETRFRDVEKQIGQRNQNILDLSLEQLEEYWIQAKQNS